MATIAPAAYQNQVEIAAIQYTQEGYKVSVNPTQDLLPTFLREFKPDIVATKGRDKVIVEVRAKGKIRQVDYWKRLEQITDEHPEWRVEIISEPQISQTARVAPNDLLSTPALRDRIVLAERLTDSGEFDMAILAAWIAIEGLLRRLVIENDLVLDASSIPALASNLTSEGIINRVSYFKIMKLLQDRNRIVHGLKSERINASIVKQAINLAYFLARDVSG